MTPENQAQYFATNGNPPSNTTAYDDPAVKEAFPMADVIRAVARAGRAPAADALLQRGVHRPAGDVAPAGVGDPGRRRPKESTDLITAVLRGEQLL